LVVIALHAAAALTSGQQTLAPAEFARLYGWKNDVRWVRFNERKPRWRKKPDSTSAVSGSKR
jgi:hypothetical protein